MPRKPPGYKNPGSVGDPMRKPPTVDKSTFQVVSDYVHNYSPFVKGPGKIAKPPKAVNRAAKAKPRKG